MKGGVCDLETFERRNQIWEKLRIRRHDTVDNLANEFDVSSRTIRRDIQAIILQKPIYTLPGKYGGIFVMEESEHIKYFDDDERAVIELLFQMVENGQIELNTSQITTLRKILVTYSKPTKRNLKK